MIRSKGVMMMSPQDILPIECWEMILKKLDEQTEWGLLSLVCKFFLSITNTMRSKLTFYVTDNDTDPAAMCQRLLVRFSCLKEIKLVRDELLNENNRGAIDSVMSGIFNNNNYCSSAAATGGSTLQSLHISCRCNCDGPEDQKPFTSFAAKDVGLNNNIRVLTCSVCSIDDQICQYFGDTFPFLEELHVDNPCFTIEWLDFIMNPHITDQGILFLTQKLKYLKRLSLSGQLSNTSLVALASCSSSLTHLSLLGYMDMDNSGIGYLLAHCPNLVSLILPPVIHSASQFVPSFTIEKSLGFHAKCLQCLDLHRFLADDLALSSIASAKLPLKKIPFSASRCTLSGLMFFFDAYHLCLSSLHFRAAKFLNDNSLAMLLNSSPNSLVEIGFDECRNLTNSSFLMLVTNCPFLTSIEMILTSLGKGKMWGQNFCHNKKIRQLKLLFNKPMGNQTLEWIGQICPNLQHLSYASPRCTGKYYIVNSSGIAMILNRCNKIRILHLVDNLDITLIKEHMRISNLSNLEELSVHDSIMHDLDLALIGKTCSGLCILDLRDCTSITYIGLACVIKKCKKLKQISIMNCDGCKNKSKILALNPSLRIIM